MATVRGADATYASYERRLTEAAAAAAADGGGGGGAASKADDDPFAVDSTRPAAEDMSRLLHDMKRAYAEYLSVCASLCCAFGGI